MPGINCYTVHRHVNIARILDKNYQKPLIAKVEDVKLYEGYAGKYKNKKVFKVEGPYVEQI